MNTPDPFDIESEHAARQEAERRAEQLRATEDDDFAELMGTDVGRRHVWRTLARAAIFCTAYSPEAMAMAHAEGRKQEGYYLLAKITTVCPDLYFLMIRENTNA